MSAISITNVAFAYSGQNVLENINADIPYGKIYSLLGPSGAGKTTLLRLVLGRIKPTTGSIQVLGGAPGQSNREIGYMPQDTALCMSFTVGQTLQYFANIYRLSAKKFAERKQTLVQVLGLPEDDKEIRELSGGQQKMVSLSLTFLHSPRLLILDEPTVGSDPVLGDCIWNYLHQCCLQNISVVIVTHYIEEAAFGHVVGIMRDGTILEEGAPDKLVAKYGEKTLEDVFLWLCQNKSPLSSSTNVVENDQNGLSAESRVSVALSSVETVAQSKHNESSPSQLELYRDLFLSLWILTVLVRKNLARFFQFNISFLIFLIPAFQALILCTLYNRDAVPVNAAVFSEDVNSFYSEKLLNSIEKVDVYYLNPIKYDSLEKAIGAITDGKAIGAIWFERNYSSALEARITDPDSVENQTLTSSNVKLFLDTTNYLFSNGFIDSIRQTVYSFLGSLYNDFNLTRLESPIEIREVVYAKDSKLSDFLLPGYLISFIYLSQVSLSSQLLIQEKKDGLFERSLVAGVGHNLVFLSHLLSSCILSVIQITLMLIVSLLIFKVTNFGSYQLIFGLVFAQAVNAISVGLLISCLFNEGFVAILASIFVTFSQLFSSGSIFPMEFVEPSLRSYLYFCPIALPSESLRNVMLRAWTITHPYVYNGLVLNLLSGAVFLLVAAFIFKRYS